MTARTATTEAAPGGRVSAREAITRRDRVALFAFTVFAHGLALRNGYTLDDARAIELHPAVNGSTPLWECFTREWFGARFSGPRWTSSYRPVASLLLALEQRVTHAPWFSHAVSLLLAGALTVLVARVASRFASRPSALVSSVLFAVIPVHVENVASLVGQADLLASLFALASLEVGLARPSSPLRALASSALFALGLFSKEVVLLVPLLGAWLVYVDTRTQPREERRRAMLLPAGLVVALLGFTAVRYAIHPGPQMTVIPPSDNTLNGLALAPRTWANFQLFGRYASLLAAPTRICADRTYADFVPSRALFAQGALYGWLGLALALVALTDAWRAVRGRSRGLWCAALLAYLLIGQWVLTLSVGLAERLLLWPSVWVCVALASALEHPSITPRRRRVLGYVALVALLFAGRSAVRTLDWRDNLRLFRANVDDCPSTVHARLTYAQLLGASRAYPEALWHIAVVAAGRSGFPGPFESRAFEAEATMPLSERLPRLPELLGVQGDHRAFWLRLAVACEALEAPEEAALARGFAERVTQR